MPVTIAQIRGARGLLGWSQVDLAKAASVSEPTIKRLEGGKVAVSEDVRSSIQSALEAAGVIFVAENGEGPGVRLRKQHSAVEGSPVEKLNASNDG